MLFELEFDACCVKEHYHVVKGAKEEQHVGGYLSLSDHLGNGDGREGHPSSHIEGATGNCKGGEHLESAIMGN